MEYREFTGELDAASEGETAPTFKPFDGKLDPRRGGTRAESAPYVALGVKPSNAGAGRGVVNPPEAQDYGLTDGDGAPVPAEDAQRQRLAPDNMKPDGLTLHQVGRDFQGGIEQVKSLGTGVAAFGAGASWRQFDQAMADMDSIDQTGQPLPRNPDAMGASQLHPYAESYALNQDPQTRQAIRAKVTEGLQRDEAFIGDAVKAIQGFNAEQQRLSGKLPEFTDVLANKAGFVEWAVRNGVATSPTMAASMLGALAGPMGLAATSGAMALGDMTSARAEFAGQTSDPKRFTSADRAAEAAAMQPGQQARHIAENTGTTAALAIPYAAADFIGPAGTLATGGAKGLASRGMRGIAAQGAKEVGKEAFNEGAQEVINIGAEVAANERPGDVTGEDAKRVFNAAAVGGLMGGGGAATNVAGDAIRSKIQADLRMRALKKAAESGDVEAAVELYALERQNMRPHERRKQLADSLDDIAAEQGITSSVIAAAKQRAEGMPLAEVPGFFKRYTAAVLRRLGREVDERALSQLDEPPPLVKEIAPEVSREALPPEMPPAPLDVETAAPEPVAPEQSLEDSLADRLGIAEPEAAPAPPPPASTQDLAGQPINRNWTAFTPESGTLNLPREQLPQIKAEHRGALVNFLGARGITHETDAEVDPASLKPTQGEFSPAKVQQAREFVGGDRSILVSADGYVLDGHHQWLAKLDGGQPVKAIRLNAPIQDLLRLAHQFPSSTTARGATRAAPINAGAPAPMPAGGNDVADGRAAVAPAPTDQGDANALRPTAGMAGESAASRSDQRGRGADAMAAQQLPGVDVSEQQHQGQPSARAKDDARGDDRGREAAPVGAAAGGAGGGTRVIARAGRTPNSTEPIELRPNEDGSLTPFMGGKAMLDFDSAQPITLPAGVSDLDAKKAIREAGAVTTKVNFYPATKGAAPPPEPAAPPPPAPPAAPPAAVATPAPAPKPKRTAPVRGSNALGQISARLGGISPDLLADLADEARFLASHIPQQPTDYARASDAMDAKKPGDGYWSTPWEKFARAFETFAMDALKDRERESLYLSGLVDSEGWRDWAESTGKSIPYPAGAERLAMQQAFQKLVDALQTRETDSGVMLYDLSRVGDRIMRMGYERQDPERIQAARNLAGLIKRLDEGKITPVYFEVAVRSLAERLDRVVTTKAANRLMAELERGPDYVRERLLRARRQGDLDEITVEFALWVLDQNPALATNLAVSVRAAKNDSAAGDYNPAAEIIRLFKGSGNQDTAVHEILHHAERMMPADMQAEVRKEWAAALAKAVKKATPQQREALALIGPALAGDQAAYKALARAIQEGPLNYADHYQLVNPSEYWAVNGARLMGNRFLAKDSIWQRVRNWFREMEQKLRGLLGLRSDAPLLRALNRVIDPEKNQGDRQSPEMLSDRKAVEAMDDVLADPQSPEAAALRTLSEDDELFALPKSEATTLNAIAFENGPTIKAIETKLPGLETMWTLTMPSGRQARITIRKPGQYGPSPYSADFDGVGYNWNTERPGDNPDDVDPDTEDVWIDVSQLKGQGEGAMVYNIASTFAHNTGRIFIGDPNGVSPDAMRRRPQHMLSSALKFGTTRHLAPHPDQVRGSKKDGIPPLQWVYGDDLGNIRRLVDLNLRLVENSTDGSRIPTFDPSTGAFVEQNGSDALADGSRSGGVRGDQNAAAGVGNQGLGSVAGLQPDGGGSAGGNGPSLAGSKTLRRVALLRALLREEGSGVEGANGRRDGLLARLVRLSAVQPDATRKLFYSLKQPAGTKAEPPAESTPRALQRKLQDQFNRFTVIREWAVEQGLNMTPDSNVWAYEERMHGRIATRVEEFREKTVKPKIQAIQKAGFTMAQVAEYLHAQHAEERNKQIESIDPANTAGSGMTTADAKAILAAADPKLAALANDFRKITEDTKAILLKAGIVSKDMTDAWEAAYKNYVPLKGGDEAAQQGTGKGLAANGKQKRALGHSERSEFVVENILRDHERAITVAEKNIVGHSLLTFIADLGREDIATIGQPEKRKVLKNSTDYEVLDGNGARIAIFDSQAGAAAFISKHSQPGLFASVKGPLTANPVRGDPSVAFMATPMLADNEVNVYVKGHAIRVQLNDPLLAQAYTRSGQEGLNQLMAMNREINAYLSKVYTGYNPEFLLTNIARDMTTGIINITGKFGAGMASKALGNYPKAFASLWRYAMTGKETPDIKAYRDAGGSTGASYLSDIERIGKDVQEAYDEYKGAVATYRDRGALPAARAAANRWLGRFLLAPIRHINEAGENAMRLAVFQAVRDTKGNTVNDAASAAKNVTVNFNRRGEWGQLLGSMYLFFNPAIQGTAAIADSLINGKHKGQGIALTGSLGVLAYMLAAGQFGGGEDDDEAWAAIPDYVKDKNLIIRTGEKTYITIPIPYGYGFFYALGNATYDLQKGTRDIDKIALKIASNLLEHFSPIGNPLGGDKPEARGMVELIPGAVGGELQRDLVRVMANRNGMGSDIVPDSPFDDGKPDSMKVYRSTKGTLYDKTARTVNSMTGGTESQAGGISVSPETLKYWTHTVTGGAGAFISDSVGLAGLGARYLYNSGDPDKGDLRPEFKEIPIFRRFVKEEGVQDRRRVFWTAAGEVREAQADLNRAKKIHDDAGEGKVWAQRGELVAMGAYMASVTKMVKAQRDLVDEVMADESTTLAYKRARVRALEKEEQMLYDEFTREFVAEKAKAKAERAATP